jgi:hypothetical protein
MKGKHQWILSGALIANLGGTFSHADELGGMYVGGNFGRARSGYDTGFIDSQLSSGATAAGDTLDLNRKSTNRLADFWSADVGYFFLPYVGLEAAFLHVGEIKYITVGSLTTAGGVESVASSTEVTSHGPALSAVLRLPLTESLEVDARLGDYFGKTTLESYLVFGANSDFSAHSKSGSSLLASLGGAYTLAAHYSLHVDYLRIEQAGDSSTGKFSVTSRRP